MDFINTKPLIRGGAILARALKEKGVSHVFTLAGGFCNPALEGFMECEMPVINTPHEQVAGHLADGHTRITRKPTVCLVGPEGFANAVPAMHHINQIHMFLYIQHCPRRMYYSMVYDL